MVLRPWLLRIVLVGDASGNPQDPGCDRNTSGRCSPMPVCRHGTLITRNAAFDMAAFSFVGAARFELTTSCSQSRRDTGLRYAPIKWAANVGS